MKLPVLATYALFALFFAPETLSFVSSRPRLGFGFQICSSSTASSSETAADVDSMRVKEIQMELKDKGVSYADCFDKESLVSRLVEAREGRIRRETGKEKLETQDSATTTSGPTESSPIAGPDSVPPPPSPNNADFDREATRALLRAMRVKELRTECANRNIRWGNMIEKEDLVQALLQAREAASNFSVSGALTPGQVGSLNDVQLEAELGTPFLTPLLLDVYATWCGPCKLMAPELVKAAEELGDRVRVAKMDSDQFPQWSSKLGVGAFPTVILFGPDGKEVQRVEGAVMKADLTRLADLALKP